MAMLHICEPVNDTDEAALVGIPNNIKGLTEWKIHESTLYFSF